MSVKGSMDKTMTALECAKRKIVKTYNFINGMSIKNKANFDLSVKHDKAFAPLWKYGFGYNKEIRVMPIVLCMIAAMVTVCTAMKIGKASDK